MRRKIYQRIIIVLSLIVIISCGLNGCGSQDDSASDQMEQSVTDEGEKEGAEQENVAPEIAGLDYEEAMALEDVSGKSEASFLVHNCKTEILPNIHL